MEQDKVLNVAIVGAGPGCKAIMDMIFAEKLGGLRMRLLGVADINPQAIGYCYAQEKGIYTTNDYRDLYKLESLNMIIELTGSDKVADEIYRTKPDHVRLMDNVAARLFWEIFQIEEKSIVERKRAEEELAAEKERLAVTLRSIGDGVITTNTGGEVALMNKVAEGLTGWMQEAAVGKPLTEVLHVVDEKTGQRCDNLVEKVIGSGRIMGLADYRVLIARDGTQRIIAENVAPIRDKDGNIVGVVLVFQDVTEKRKLEEELLKAQKLESIGILAGGIAHDFNNILTSILGNITLAKMYTPPEDKISERLTKAEKACLHARDLTLQLLTFSKGGAPIIRTASIAGVLRDVCPFALSGSNVGCKLSIPDDLWLVDIDEGQMRQVVNNLVINAQQSMPEGGIIQGGCENVILKEEDLPLRPGKYVRIFIKDQGVGIPEEHLRKIFDPYFTTKSKGSGLGLTNCYAIIKKHNGYIRVESEPGAGTTFHVYLPAAAEQVLAKDSGEETTFGGKGRVLVMDDEEIIRDISGEMLRHIGYEVGFAKDGDEAIEIYKRAQDLGQPFDAVIMDLTIPGGMGGREAIQKLVEINPEVKVIVSSGYSNDPIMAEFRKYGFSGVVAKPYNIEELSKTLHQVIAGTEP